MDNIKKMTEQTLRNEIKIHESYGDDLTHHGRDKLRECKAELKLRVPHAPEKALDVQVGGNHYKDFEIQPIEYITKNNLDWYQGNIVKYASRHKFKNGKQDLEKVIHYAQLAIEAQYPEEERVVAESLVERRNYHV